MFFTCSWPDGELPSAASDRLLGLIAEEDGTMTPVTESLRHSVRDRIERGILDPAPLEVWAGQGTGRTCIVCATVISPDQVENEIVIRTNGIAVTLWVHLPCLNIWRWESMTFATRHS